MKFNWNGKEYYIDGYLMHQIESICYNIDNDWDFVILVSGDRSVRVGKSVFTQTICAYYAYTMNKLGHKVKYDNDDIYFDNKVMMDEAQKKPKYAINHYDEAREGLAANKAMKSFQQDLMDFFNECGQLNQLFVVVLPDFFGLKEEIAVARSEFLINVYRKETPIMTNKFKGETARPVVRLDRGYFEFFSRTKKRLLFDISRSTRRKTYNLVKADFYGKFTNQYCVDEEEYKAKKKDSLARFQERHDAQNSKTEKTHVFRDKIIFEQSLKGKSATQIKNHLEENYDYEISSRQINNILKVKHDSEENKEVE